MKTSSIGMACIAVGRAQGGFSCSELVVLGWVSPELEYQQTDCERLLSYKMLLLFDPDLRNPTPTGHTSVEKLENSCRKN